MVVDATFLTLQQRRRMQHLADRLDAGFCILDCDIPVELARRRLIARRRIGADPSDADQTVLDQQVVTGEPLSEKERIQSILVNESVNDQEPFQRVENQLKRLLERVRTIREWQLPWC